MMDPVSTSGRKKAGRKPSAATRAVIEAMLADKESGTVRSRAEYVEVLRKAGHSASANSAALIITREAKRLFGRPLGRGGAGPRKDTRGRRASPATNLLREKLAVDTGGSGLKEPAHYVRWLVDQPGIKLGLKQARPIVYRELRAAR